MTCPHRSPQGGVRGTGKYTQNRSNALALASGSLTHYRWQQPRPKYPTSTHGFKAQNPGASNIFPCACSAIPATREIYTQGKQCKRRENLQIQVQNRAFSCTVRRVVSGPRRRRAGCPWRRTCARLTHSPQPPGLRRRRPNFHAASHA